MPNYRRLSLGTHPNPQMLLKCRDGAQSPSGHGLPPAAHSAGGCRHRLLPAHLQLEGLSVLEGQLQDPARGPEPEPGLPAGGA